MPLAAATGAAVPHAARTLRRDGAGRQRRQRHGIQRHDSPAKGDVALSVTISSVSTLVGVVATPLLTRLYVDAHIQVDVMGMLLSILQIVVIPIGLGLIVHHLLPKVVKAVEPFLPAFSMLCILAIISAVVAGSASHIASVGPVVIVAVILHNAIGLLGGYWGGRLFGFDESTCRTLAIEVGMQNSGLAAALGKIYFGPLAALPGALFSVWHNLSGSLLAGYWSGKPTTKKRQPALIGIRPGKCPDVLFIPPVNSPACLTSLTS